MIGSLVRDSSLFYAAFGAQAELIHDPELGLIDELLDDEQLIEIARQQLGTRRPKSKKTGRPGIAPDQLVRCCALKHIKVWSLRDLHTEVRNSLVYRRFTRYDAQRIPVYSTFSRVFGCLGPDGTKAIHDRILQKARELKVAQGHKLRTDTTVVETNIHHPTDSSLLADGIRVLSTTMKSIAEQCQETPQDSKTSASASPEPKVPPDEALLLRDPESPTNALPSEELPHQPLISSTTLRPLTIVDHSRSVKHRLLEINRAAKCLTEAGRTRLKDSYAKLVDLASRVVTKATGLRQSFDQGRLVVTGSILALLGHLAHLQHFIPLIQQVLMQTKARVFDGNTRFEGKLLSLFETATAAIRKGKVAKPTEFGRLTRIDEVENGIVSDYQVNVGNPADTDSWKPALLQHKAKFGSAPRLATGDRGFFSAANEKLAKALGVLKVALPAKGKLSRRRLKLQKERWFRRALRWRAGVESRISTLKHVFGMNRAVYKGESGFDRHVGWSVIANNLVSIVRTITKRKTNEKHAR